ncbi:MAG: hypothetical protein KAH57_05995 [Thermoplasmata archaeon]|nr:hypothetical protein [Thermoplasmata archaeon]
MIINNNGGHPIDDLKEPDRKIKTIQGKDNTPVSVAILGLSALILLSGCLIAVYRDDQNSREIELDRSSDLFIDTINDLFSWESGYFSLALFLSTPEIDDDISGRDGRDFKIVLTIIDHAPMEIKYGDGGHDSSRMTDIVAVDMGDGSVRPGLLEVILYEA